MNERDLKLRLYEKISEYQCKTFGEAPKRLSISYEYYHILLKIISPYFTSNGEGIWTFAGIPINWVRRSNYVEALPRIKRF